MSVYERDPTTGDLNLVSGMRSIDDVKALMLEFCYPVGSFYISTKNVSPQTFLGGTWESRSGYMLRAATSDVTFDKANDTIDGGADSVTVSSVASHNHSTSSDGAHGHNVPYTGTGANGYASYKLAAGQESTVGISSNGSAHNHTITNKGANYTVNTLPKYKNVYMWERTA